MPSGVKKVEVDLEVFKGYLVFLQHKSDHLEAMLPVMMLSNNVRSFIAEYVLHIKDTCLSLQNLLLP